MNPVVMAFDILPMASPYRMGGTRVAVSAILADGSRKEWSEVSRSKLLKLVKKHNVRYLGTDNPSEIIGDGESIASFCDLLPTTCNFVHVNLTRSGITIPLKSLFSQYNISKRKLSPVKTARGLVQLIQQGVGMILDPYEHETLIKVSRPSGSSKGGWSQARYQRQNEEVVAREAKKVKRILESHKIAFDDIIYKTKYGAKMARFHIFNSRKEIDKILSEESFYPAKVKVWSPKKQVVTHKPIHAKQPDYPVIYSHLQKLMVGVDPGMTTGVAILNLHGKLVTSFSRKNLAKGELTGELSNYGVPVLICADVTPVPNFVSKLATTYNAELYSPAIELSKGDKRALAKKSKVNRRIDSHEQDAIAAVMNAYLKYKSDFKKIDETEDLSYKQRDVAKSLLIRGLSLADSITSVQLLKVNKEEIIQEIAEPEVYDNSMLLGRITNILEELALSEEIISNLRAHTGRLNARNEILNTQIRQLIGKLRQIQNEEIRKSLSDEVVERKDEIINSLKTKMSSQESQISYLNRRVSDLEELLWLSLEEGGMAVKILTKFSHESIEALRKERGINDGDIILIKDPTGGGPQTAENLSQRQLKFIFTYEKDLPSAAWEVFYAKGIPVRKASKYGIRVTNYLGLINHHNLAQAQEDYNSYVEARVAEEKKTKILREIENYKYERTKEILQEKKNYDDYEPDDDELV